MYTKPGIDPRNKMFFHWTRTISVLVGDFVYALHKHKKINDQNSHWTMRREFGYIRNRQKCPAKYQGIELQKNDVKTSKLHSHVYYAINNESLYTSPSYRSLVVYVIH